MQHHPAALDMAEEAVAQSDALMRAFDQAGQIGHHEFAAIDREHAELRMQRGEGIIRDLRLGRADGGEEGRLAGIRQADEAGIGDQLQPQPDRHFDRGLTGIGVAWRAVGRGLEMRVAEAAIAALRQQHLVAELVEIGEQGLAVFLIDLGADRHLQDQVLAVGAVAVLAHAIAAALRLVVLQIAVIDQGIEPVHRARDHVATVPAVAAIGPAELDEFFAPERDAAVSAGAGLDVDLGFVEEFHERVYRRFRGLHLQIYR